MTTSPYTPVHVTGEVLATRKVGAFRHLTLVAPGIPERFRPGNFVALSTGADRLGCRAMWIHRVKPTGGYGATIELVVEPVGPGTRWLASLPTGARVEITGPLGRPFALPKEPVSCVLVGEGYAAAPMFPLAERLRERDCAVTLVVAAYDEAHLLSALEARRSARAVTVVTGDGSIGSRGTVADVLPDVLAKAQAEVVYAAGSASTLHQVASAAEQAGAWSQTALEQPMACGTGLCQGCAVPVVGEDGVARMVRACVDGPVFRGDRVRWDDVEPRVQVGSA
jgi:dihydroorotate dehydrogenase electron transfer subunit